MAYQTEDANRKTCLMYAAEKLHQALFDCIEEFFTEWHCGRTSWTNKTPLLSTTTFTRLVTLNPSSRHLLLFILCFSSVTCFISLFSPTTYLTCKHAPNIGKRVPCVSSTYFGNSKGTHWRNLSPGSVLNLKSLNSEKQASMTKLIS